MERIKMKSYYWNCSGLSDFAYDVFFCVAVKKGSGIGTAEKIVDPLYYWINTGRITVEESKKLVKKKPYMVGRNLIKNYPNSLEGSLKALKAYVNQ